MEPLGELRRGKGGASAQRIVVTSERVAALQNYTVSIYDRSIKYRRETYIATSLIPEQRNTMIEDTIADIVYVAGGGIRRRRGMEPRGQINVYQLLCP